MKRNCAIEFVADIIRFALLLAFAGSILGQDFDAIDRSATEELSQLKIPGAAIAVIKGDRIVYSKAFGIANVETYVLA